MRELLQKIYDTVVPVSWKKHKEFMEAMTIALDGAILAIDQQAEMLSSLVNQINGIQMKKAGKAEPGKKEEVDDPAFG